MEFSSCVWSPFYDKYVVQIEKIQKRFTRFLNFKTYSSPSSYRDSCNQHKMLSLSNRRILLDMSFLHDIINSNIDSPDLVSSLGINIPRKRTRHTSMRLLHTPLRRTNYGLSETLTRLAHTYNTHFSHIDLFNLSKPAFKKHVTQTVLEIID